MKHKWWKFLTCSMPLAVLLLQVSVCQVARAQTVNGAFHGTITDASGAVIPGASVAIKNLATGTGRAVTSDAAGHYEITQVLPAHYSITVSKEGFETLVQPDVQLLVNEDREASFALRVGAVTEHVEVTAAVAALQTTVSTLGTVVASHEVVDLPLNGRNFSELILLSPGAVPVGGDQQQSNAIVTFGAGGISPTVNGQTGRQNNFTMDGGNNNELYRNVWQISPPPDAIQEFKIQTDIIDTQVGSSPGANVNVVTKSGSEKLHGDLWEFDRNDKFDAANYFTNYSSLKKAPFRMNQFGFTLGGPVILPMPNGLYDGRKAKTFFFAYYEGFRSIEGETNFNNFPTANELGGEFSDILTTQSAGVDDLGRPLFQGQIFNPYSTRQVTQGAVDPVTGLVATATGLVREPFSGNIIPQSLLATTSPAALEYLKAFFPLPNFGPGGNSFPNYVNTSPLQITSDQFSGKIDHTFGNNDTLFGAFYFTQPNQSLPDTELNNIDRQELVNHARVVNVGYTHIFNPSTLITVHYNYLHSVMTTLNSVPPYSLLTETNQLQFQPVKDGIAQITRIGLSPRLAGTNQFAIPEGPNRSQILAADFQKVAGNHTLSAGGLLYHIHAFADGWGMGQYFDQYPSGAIAPSGANIGSTGDGLASMLLNLPSDLSGFLGQTAYDGTDFWKGAYLNDKWMASKNLTVTIGMRYDYVPPGTWKNNRTSGWSNNCGCFLITQPFGVEFPYANVRPTYFDPQERGFQPRIGLAYKIVPKVVFRAGVGAFDDHGENLIQEIQDLRIPWPFGVDPNLVEVNAGIPNPAYTFSNPPHASSFFPDPANPHNLLPIFSGANNENKIPTVVEWNGGVQAQLSPTTLAEVQYVGNRSNHLQLGYEDNTPLPSEMGPGSVVGRGAYPIPGLGEFGYDTNIGYGDYNAMQVKFERRYSSGVSLLASYTWSHCLTIDSGQYATSVPNPFDLDSQYGNCNFNFPHLVTISYVYDLPFGRGKHFGSGWSRGVDTVLGGWRFSGIVSAHSGFPFTVLASHDVANTGTGGQRAVQTGPALPSGFKQTQAEWYDPANFTDPPVFTFGGLGVNTLRGPSNGDWDFGLMKRFNFTESKYLEFRGEFFNALNHANLGNPASTVGAPDFMGIYSALEARDIQFSLKLFF